MGRKKWTCIGIAAVLTVSAILAGCQSETADKGVVEIQLVQYKQEAVEVFETLEEQFNASHDHIHLTIESPNDATTILRTKFIREEYPDIMSSLGNSINN